MLNDWYERLFFPGNCPGDKWHFRPRIFEQLRRHKKWAFLNVRQTRLVTVPTFSATPSIGDVSRMTAKQATTKNYFVCFERGS